MGDIERITLGDYRRLNNIDEVTQRFQPVNPILFNIKHSVIVALRKKQFSGREFEDYNAHLTHFLEACNTINPNGVSESDKRLCLFVYSPNGRAEDWRNALPSGTITTWGDLKKAFPAAFFPTTKYLKNRKQGDFRLPTRRQKKSLRCTGKVEVTTKALSGAQIFRNGNCINFYKWS
jgi:hypothetical protein